MPDHFAYPFLALVAAGMIALALVWPQGRGAVSPAPFGHPLAPLPAAAPPLTAPPAALIGGARRATQALKQARTRIAPLVAPH
jgi:hypothetical protein